MPTRAKSHGSLKRAKQAPSRGTTAERGYGGRWQRASKAFLLLNRWCSVCREKGLWVLATEVDHVVPHKGDMGLFWSQDNWDAKCKRCHSVKTCRDDGGFGLGV